MKIPTTKIGAWAAVLLASNGFGMLLCAFPRYQTSQAWAAKAGVDLATWCWLGAVFLVGGICLGVIVRLPERK
ncbi:hypothetical protein ASD89_20040 [Caulobacter sp. Root656]|nr:hypothetical protein ASD89_20040 [Caulobacter sp. Root656]